MPTETGVVWKFLKILYTHPGHDIKKTTTHLQTAEHLPEADGYNGHGRRVVHTQTCQDVTNTR